MPEMPTAFFIDLCWKMIWMRIAHQLPMNKIAALLGVLGVSECTVQRIVKLFIIPVM